VRLSPLITLLILIGLNSAAATDGVDTDNYAWHWPLSSDQAPGLWRIELEPAIIETLHRDDGSDLLVTDDLGQAVVFARIDRERLIESLSESQSLSHTASRIEREPLEDEGLELSLEQHGTRLLLRAPRRMTDTDAEGRLVFEALIAGPQQATNLPRHQLMLTLESEQRLELDCRLRDADDNEPAAQRARFIAIGDTRPRRYQARIELGHLARAWYLGCYSRQAAPQDLELRAASLESQGEIDHGRADWINTQPTSVDTPDGSFEFELSGPFLARAIEVTGTRPNLLSNLMIESRAGTEQAWRHRARLSLSTLGEVEGSVAVLNPPQSRDRHWRLRSDPPLPAAPEVRVQVEIDQLLFLAQGQAPWHLYTGSRQGGPLQATSGLIENTEARLGPAWHWPGIDIGARQTAGGPQVLEAEEDPIAWLDYLLWTILILAAGLVVWLGTRLLRDDS
jgi:hypothetical protein